MQYGYTGPISTSWRSQNPADAATLAEAMATQVLIWETVVGERDEDFDYVSPGSYDAVKSVISTAHPLYDLFCDYYDSIEASVQRHSAIPSFMSKNPNRAQSVELEWDGSSYTATLTDHNRVLSDYSFSANEDGIGYPVTLGTDTFGNITRLDNALEGLPKRLEMNEMELDNLKKQFETAKVDVERPFPQEEELKAKTDRLNELNALLNADKRENEIVGGEPDEGEELPEKKPRNLER